MLWIRPNFIDTVEDDVPTNEELRMHDSDMESNEEEDVDDPNLGEEAYDPETDDDMDDV